MIVDVLGQYLTIKFPTSNFSRFKSLYSKPIQEPETNLYYSPSTFSRGGGLNRLKGVFAKNERGYRLNAIKKRF